MCWKLSYKPFDQLVKVGDYFENNKQCENEEVEERFSREEIPVIFKAPLNNDIKIASVASSVNEPIAIENKENSFKELELNKETFVKKPTNIVTDSLEFNVNTRPKRLLLFSYFNAMSDRQRHYFSGSQKRKLKEKKEQEKMKHTKLTQFFVPNKANLPGENEQTIISTIIEDKENVEKTKCQPNTSEKTIDNENDTDSFQGQNYESTSSHTANRSFAKEYIGDALIADADLGKNAERYQDIALWPDSVDNEMEFIQILESWGLRMFSQCFFDERLTDDSFLLLDQETINQLINKAVYHDIFLKINLRNIKEK
ncbi:hypothetical protein RN001_001509 [Aquatica leii]|uniref:SAM domain-containing protein n=1 Tax=Aquatica leii TaxID=1421715 RepID=A0AAN7SQX9_9COLE|nr:hypothetical protein RN001_001509 [Aquatica leii]